MSDIVNLNSVFKVKNPATGSWEQIPAVKGTSVGVEIASTSSLGRNGTIVKFTDEKKQIEDPSYTGDIFIIWDGLNGTGSVNTVDQESPDNEHNVSLNAVRYVEQALQTAEQSQARANINAFKDIAVTSAEDGYLPKYSALSGLWTAASLEVSEVANAVPSARKVNNYPLSTDISLNPDDIGAIHSGLKINNVSINNPTTSDASIKLTPATIGALHSSFKINGFSVVNAVSSNAAITLAPASIGAMHSALKINGEAVNNPTTGQANITTRIITPNASVSSGAWSSSSTPSSYIDVGFPYRATVPIATISSDMIPQVVFSLEDSMSGTFAPIAETIDSGVYIYASDIPANDIIIPTIVCFK